MDIKFCTIASGSSGNCTYLQVGETPFLIDVGISGKKTTEGLTILGTDPHNIEAIFVTHEHSDHIKGVGIFSRKYNTPIYATKKTWEAMLEGGAIGKVKEENQKILEKETPFYLQELTVIPYGIYHDAADPVGYNFLYKDKKITIATDMGIVDEKIKQHLEGANGILLEFNHDIHMLQAGYYPYPLKKRILGEYGHLNNEAAARVLADIYHKEMKWAMLGHLSKDNNLPELAYLTAKNTFKERSIPTEDTFRVSVAKRDTLSDIYYL